MTPLEAIEKATGSYMRLRGSFGGVALWSDGHILVPADFAGRDHDGPAEVWGESINRAGETEAALGPCVDSGRKVIYRALEACGVRVWINEAYRQTLQGEGVTAHVLSTTAAITFRIGSELVGVAMPVKNCANESLIEPTEGHVWASIACGENGFFRQSRADVRARLKAEYGEAVSARRKAQDTRDEAEDEINGADEDISRIEAQIVALDELDRAEAMAAA